MTRWLHKAKQWSLAAAASATFLCGVFALTSCGGEGGPVGDPGGGGDDAIAKQFLALLPAGQQGATYVGADRCGQCHNGSNSSEPYYDHWKDTLHASVKVGCEQCHGPGSNHASAPSSENILNLPKATDPVVCGQCHGPMFKDYQSSGHNELLITPVEDAIENPQQYGRSSRCITCHSGLARLETYEQGIDIGTLSDEEIRELAEDTLSSAPHTATCTTCHNPHMKTGLVNQDGKESHLRHPVTNTDTAPVAPGAPASSTTTFNHICAQCHNGRGANGADSALMASTSRPNMHDSNQFNTLMGIGGAEGGGPPVRTTAHSTIPGQCSKCHMPNARHTFTVSFDGGCQPCHTSTDAAARTSSAKSQITELLYETRSRLQAWSMAQFGSPNLWDYTSLISGETPPDQSLVPIEVRRARHNYYFVVRDGSFGVHNLRYERFLLNYAIENLDSLGAPTISKKDMPSPEARLQFFREERVRAKKLHLGNPQPE